MLWWAEISKYMLVKFLNFKYPDQYDWIYPVHGDWHILKTASEVIKYVLQTVGLENSPRSVAIKGKLVEGHP